VLPLLGALIHDPYPMPPDLAVWTDCGGGVSARSHSNLIQTYLAKGIVALSVTLTAIN